MFNDKFFSKTNIKNSYWAGFIAADGSIHLRRPLLEIALNKKDKKHLLKFKKAIKSDKKMYFNSGDNTYKFSITSKEYVKYLNENFNITSRKSLTLKPPKGLTRRQQLAFIAGYIDGDGCIWFRNNNIVLEILGTKKLLTWIKSILIKQFNYKNSLKISKKGNIFKLRATSNNIRNVLKTIKRNSPVMERKWNLV